MTDMFYQRIRQKLDELGISDREASMKVSGTPDLIRNIKRGKSESLRGPRLVKLAALLGVSPIWLQTGEYEHLSSEELAASLTVDRPHDSEAAYARESYQPKNPGGLPELDAGLGAGDGQSGEVLALPIGGEAYSGHKVVAEWLLPEPFIRNEAKASVLNTIVLPVTGDSMLPNYNYGDRVLVDLSQNVVVGQFELLVVCLISHAVQNSTQDRSNFLHAHSSRQGNEDEKLKDEKRQRPAKRGHEREEHDIEKQDNYHDANKAVFPPCISYFF